MPNRTRATQAQAQTPSTQVAPQAASPAVSNEEAQRLLNEGGGGLTDYLSGVIADNLDAGKVDDALTGGVDSGGDWLTDQMVDAASDEDKAIAREHGGAKIDELATGINGAIVDSKIGENVSGFAADNPWLTAGLATAGVAGYILSDQDLEFGTDFDLGKHHQLSVEGDFGSTLDPGIDALRGGYTYDDGTHRAHVEGGSRFDRDEWDVKGQYRRRFENGSSLTFDASHRDRAGDTFSTLGARYDSDTLDAFAKGSYDSEKDLGRLQAGFTTDRDGPDWTGSLDADTTGRFDASLGVSDKSEDGNWEWFAGVGAGRTAGGETDYQAKAGLSFTF